jgi:hypothetical protein
MSFVRNQPFDKPGQFYRGNTHAHSVNSDGSLTPAEVVAAYRDRDYDFVAVTDHYMERFGFPVTDTRDLRTRDFTTLIGAELHGPGLDNGGLWHILALGLPLDFEPQEPGEDGSEIAARARAAGAFVALPHPQWTGVSPKDARKIADFDAIEIHNEGHTTDSDRGNGWFLADLMATAGHRFSVTAADDAHFNARPDSFGGWICVKAEALEPEALLEAMKQGRYYASTGPEILNVAFTGDEIVVECSEAEVVMVGGPGSVCRYQRESGMTRATFPMAPFGNAFARITVIDKHGKKAWTSPIWLDELTIT